MTKEPGQPPKAVNIIRPTNNNYGLLHNTTSTSTNGSSNFSGKRSLIHSGHSSVLSSNSIHSTTATSRKVRVNSTSIVKEKPVLNIYHPPSVTSSRKSSYDLQHEYKQSATSRPNIEMYKPPSSQQQRMTKSVTAPILQENVAMTTTTPNSTPPAYMIRNNSRSVLGPIVTPVAPTTAAKETTVSHYDEHHTSDSSDNESEDNEEELSDKDDLDPSEAEDDDEEEPVINEARVNRKIADLELSIKSLLTVNAMLESTVRKQALQLSQFKSKMLSGESVESILDDSNHLLDMSIEEASAEEEENEEDWEQDVVFQRLRKITELLIEQGQKSVDFEYKILGRVLSNYTPIDDEEEDSPEEAKDEIIESTTIPCNTTTTTNNKIPEITLNNTRRIPRLVKRTK